jgi:hypothetical protein
MPKSAITPKYDFLYYVRDYNKSYCFNGDIYTVAKGKIKIAEIVNSKEIGCNYDVQTDPPKIYKYSAVDGIQSQISLEDAQKLTLDNNPISPDGLSIRNGDSYNAGIFELFGGVNRNYNQINLIDSKGNAKVVDIGTSYNYNFVFVGWVI